MQNYRKNIKDMYQHSIEKIFYYKELDQIEPIKSLELAQRPLHSSKVCFKVEFTL